VLLFVKSVRKLPRANEKKEQLRGQSTTNRC
jgi:hypothetical protein